MACAFSIMSERRRTGLSEGNGSVSVDLGLKAFLAYRLFDLQLRIPARRLPVAAFRAKRRRTPGKRAMPYHGRMAELVFEVVQEPDGGYCAECLTENIFTQGDTWEDLRKNVIEATSAFYFDREPPEQVRLHLVRDEILSVA
jgi:hypothetical protein